MSRVAEKQRDVSVGAEVDDVAYLRFQLAVFVKIVVADVHRLVPGNRADPTRRVAILDKTSVGADGAHGDDVGENWQPNRDDAAINHLVYRLGRDRRHLSAAHIA